MDVLSVDAKLRHCADILRSGGIVICPTEGIYGFSSIANNDDAILRIIDIKRREHNKGLILVASSFDMIKDYIDISSIDADIVRQMYDSWPGHHTWVVPCTKKVSLHLTGNRRTVAVRVSPYHLLQKLCEYANAPLVSTSANFSGCDPITDLDILRSTFSNAVDYILDEPCGGAKKPSTIHDAQTGRILRP